MYSIIRLNLWNILKLNKAVSILHKCGKDMAKRYDLHHWDNSYLKNWLIIIICALKNKIYLVTDGKSYVATFQTKKRKEMLCFQKLATDPSFSGKGVGSFCLSQIELMAAESGCTEVVCDVYDKSAHAIQFYENRGYHVYGTCETIKYKELKMKKKL